MQALSNLYLSLCILGQQHCLHKELPLVQSVTSFRTPAQYRGNEIVVGDKGRYVLLSGEENTILYNIQALPIRFVMKFSKNKKIRAVLSPDEKWVVIQERYALRNQIRLTLYNIQQGKVQWVRTYKHTFPAPLSQQPVYGRNTLFSPDSQFVAWLEQDTSNIAKMALHVVDIRSGASKALTGWAKSFATQIPTGITGNNLSLLGWETPKTIRVSTFYEQASIKRHLLEGVVLLSEDKVVGTISNRDYIPDVYLPNGRGIYVLPNGIAVGKSQEHPEYTLRTPKELSIHDMWMPVSYSSRVQLLLGGGYYSISESSSEQRAQIWLFDLNKKKNYLLYHASKSTNEHLLGMWVGLSADGRTACFHASTDSRFFVLKLKTDMK